MRHARPEGRQKRGARHARALARRRAGPAPIDLNGFGEAAARIAGATALDVVAFALWNLGTRSPLGLVRAVGASLRRPRALLAGILAAVTGLIFIAAATVLLLPAITDLEHDFIPLELGTLLVALVLEGLIGPDFRRLYAARSWRFR